MATKPSLIEEARVILNQNYFTSLVSPLLSVDFIDGQIKELTDKKIILTDKTAHDLVAMVIGDEICIDTLLTQDQINKLYDIFIQYLEI